MSVAPWQRNDLNVLNMSSLMISSYKVLQVCQFPFNPPEMPLGNLSLLCLKSILSQHLPQVHFFSIFASSPFFLNIASSPFFLNICLKSILSQYFCLKSILSQYLPQVHFSQYFCLLSPFFFSICLMSILFQYLPHVHSFSILPQVHSFSIFAPSPFFLNMFAF